MTTTDGRKKPVLGEHPVRTVTLSVLGIVAAVLLLLWFIVFPNSTQSAGNQKETGIAAAFEDGANALSSCTNATNQAAAGALANADAFRNIMLAAVSRTGDAQSYQLTNQNGSLNQTARQGLYALFVQAYPDQKGVTDLFSKAVDTATACQSKYESAQSLVIDRVRSFDSWRTGSWMSRQFWKGQANDNLIITLPGTRTVLTGTAALTIARAPIVSSVVSAAYQSGSYNPGNPFAPVTPSALPTANTSAAPTTSASATS